MTGGLGGTWVSWLSDTTNAIEHIKDVGPWYLTDGNATLVFNNKTDLATHPLAAIVYNENGQTDNSDGVWTGTAAGGTASGQSCQQWTDGTSGSVGTFGKSDYYTGAAWTSFQTLGCNSPLRLYCFEQ